MRKLFWILVILATNGHAIAQKSDFFTSKDSIRVNGLVIGFKPGSGDDFISFLEHDITGDTKKQSVQLKNDGTFTVTLYQPFAGDITVNYHDAFLNMYVEPGQSQSLEIRNKDIDVADGKAFTAKGKWAGLNNLLFEFQAEFLQHQFHSKAELGNKQQADTVFAQKRAMQLDEELEFLKAFIKNKKVTDPAFGNWEKLQLTYAAVKETVMFPFFGKLNRSITESQLIDLVKNTSISNNNALHNSSYYDFLNMLALDEQIIVNINTAYDSVRKANGYNSVPLYLNRIDQVSTGIARQLMFYDIYKSQSKTIEANKVLERFDSTITDPYLKTIFTEAVSAAASFKAYSIIDRLKVLKVSDSLKRRMIDVFTKAHGTNLYIDFWGDWCGPCMMEMPDYPKLIAQFSGKPVRFVFFSSQMTEMRVRNVRNKYHIEGDFINLSKDEITIMNNAFAFHSYPSHFVVDSNGNVISNTARTATAIKKALALK